MWKLFLLEESITMQSLESFRTLEVTFSYFTSWNQFDIWIIFGIFEKGLLDPVHRKSMGQIRLKLAWSNPAWPGPRPTGANLAPRARRRFPTAQCSLAPPHSPKPTPCSPPFWPCHGFPPQPRAPPRSRLILCESPNVEAKSPFTFSSSRTTSMSRSSPCLCSSRAAEANRRINAVGQAAPRRWPSHRLSLPLPCQSCCRIAYMSATPSFFRHRWQPPPDTTRPAVAPTRTASAYCLSEQWNFSFPLVLFELNSNNVWNSKLGRNSIEFMQNMKPLPSFEFRHIL
jgi:hypothetical protein